MMPLGFFFVCSGGKRGGSEGGRKEGRDDGGFIQYVDLCTHL